MIAAIATAVGFGYQASGSVIAVETFSGYTANQDWDSLDVNRAVVTGNTGFDSTQTGFRTGGFDNKIWWGQPTADNRPSHFDFPHSGITTHPTGSGTGNSAGLKVSNSLTRVASRNLASLPPSSSVYYMSGVVRVVNVARLGTDSYASMGLVNESQNNNIGFNTGMHLGARKSASDIVTLAAFAGGQAFDLSLPAGSTPFTAMWQIVLRLDVNETGDDTLSAWVGLHNATELHEALAPTIVSTFTSTSDLSRFMLQASQGTAAAADPIFFDEFRFGTTLESVTTMAIPEPAHLAFILGLMGLACMVIKRKICQQ